MEQVKYRQGSLKIPVYKSKILHVGILIFFAFWVVALILDNIFQVYTTQMVRIAVGTAIVVAYTPICIAAMRRDTPPDRVSQLSIGITLSWLGTVCHSLWVLLWFFSGRPLWMGESNLVSFFYTVQILGGIMHLTAPGNVDGRVPSHNWISVGVAFGAGVFSASVIFILQPDFSEFATWISQTWLFKFIN